MSSTFTIRIPRELKEKDEETSRRMERRSQKLHQKKVKHLELTKTIEEIESRAEKQRLTVDSTMLIREDRER